MIGHACIDTATIESRHLLEMEIVRENNEDAQAYCVMNPAEQFRRMILPHFDEVIEKEIVDKTTTQTL